MYIYNKTTTTTTTKTTTITKFEMNTFEWFELLRSDLRKVEIKEKFENFRKKDPSISREQLINEKRKFCMNKASKIYRDNGKNLKISKRKLLEEKRELLEQIKYYKSQMGQQI